ncbi:MAG: hypothetical protein P1U44_14510 [Vicingaceae bacterium]|nr:hypothetical protein [Vicingaceae bacterium]
MKTLALIPLIAITFLACNAQEKKEDSKLKNEPKESWSVNKKTDENGNITEYDSTYTWSYSNMDRDSIDVNLDSVMHSFNDFFNTTYSFGWNENFSFFPKNDSLLNHEFFNHNYFYDNWERQQFNIERMMQQMDSTRNEYLKKFYPGLMESDPKKIKSSETE